MKELTVLEIVTAITALNSTGMEVRGHADTQSITCVAKGIDVETKHIIKSLCGYGHAMDEAAKDLWQKMTVDLPADHWLVYRGGPRNAETRHRWNGFMWTTLLPEDK